MSNYVLVEEGVVTTTPAPLPKNWNNISNLPLLSDPELLALGWYPCNVIVPDYDEYYEYLSGYDYIIYADYVDATYQIHVITPVPLPPVEGEVKVDARDVAKQGEDIWLHDQSRRDVGATPIIADTEKAIWDDWMRDNYNAMDAGLEPVEPPPEIRRAIDMPQQEEGQCVISWHEFAGTWPGWGFQAVFDRNDVTSLGLKVYEENGSYLYALTFQATAEPTRWVTETPEGYATPTKAARSFEIIAGSAPVTEMITLDDTVDYRSLIVKWQSGDAP